MDAQYAYAGVLQWLPHVMWYSFAVETLSSSTFSSLPVMTLFLPLYATSPCYSTPPFVKKSSDSKGQIAILIKSILNAKRIVVICGKWFTLLLVIAPLANLNGYKIGAGISVEAGIPDFRSADGLFHRLKQEHPTHGLKSGKDLFDASVFNVSSLHSHFPLVPLSMWWCSSGF